MNQDKRVHLSFGNEPRGYHRLSKCSGGGQNARIMSENSFPGFLLRGSEFSMKIDLYLFPSKSLVSDLRLNMMFSEEMSAHHPGIPGEDRYDRQNLPRRQ